MHLGVVSASLPAPPCSPATTVHAPRSALARDCSQPRLVTVVRGARRFARDHSTGRATKFVIKTIGQMAVFDDVSRWVGCSRRGSRRHTLSPAAPEAETMRSGETRNSTVLRVVTRRWTRAGGVVWRLNNHAESYTTKLQDDAAVSARDEASFARTSAAAARTDPRPPCAVVPAGRAAPGIHQPIGRP